MNEFLSNLELARLDMVGANRWPSAGIFNRAALAGARAISSAKTATAALAVELDHEGIGHHMSLHYISDRSLMRSGYIYEEVPGGWVGHPLSNAERRQKERLDRLEKLGFKDAADFARKAALANEQEE